LTNNNRLIGTSVDHSSDKFDAVLISDMTRGGDIGLRIRREVQALTRSGYRCAFRHLPPGSRQTISPDIQRCVREGLALPVPAGTPVAAKLAIAYSPGTLNAPVDLDGLSAEQVVLVVDSPPSPKQMGYWFGFGFGPMTWAPTNRWVRARLEGLGFPVPVLEEDWRAIAVPCRPRPEFVPGRIVPVLGRVSTGSAAQWPVTAETLDTTYPAGGAFDIWMHGSPPAVLRKESGEASAWTILDPAEMSVERFLEAIDVLAYFPSDRSTELPEASIVAAMASGKPVILPEGFRPLFGQGAVYADPSEALDVAAHLLGDAPALDALRQKAAAHCRWSNPEAAYVERIEALIGPPVRPPATEIACPVTSPAKSVSKGEAPRVLFVPSSGIGLGHVTRLLAIARRIDDAVEPVFASLGQAGDVIDAFGYNSEYIPSQSDTRVPISEWDAWFRHDLGEVIDRHEPAVVVFDGNNPTPGLVRAALAHGACRLVWVRRGMCPETPSPFLDNARFFDCVIEPGEYAAELDKGPTSRLRHEVVLVPPIRLLDDAELLSREDARREMGLAPDRPAVLVQPGSGANRDIVELTDRLVSDLRRFEGLQIIIAEWSNGAISLPHWPGTRRLRGFPISRCFAAFDFSVAAAGYNTFHEVIAHGLPTIFVANRHPSMDDQGARAEFAQERGAAFDLKEHEMHLFPTLCRAMLSPEANAVLREGCAAFDRANGAAEAAAIIKRLASVAP